MTALPEACLLVRTWFGDHHAWKRLVLQVRTPSTEGFLAIVSVVDDPAFEGLTPEILKATQSGGSIVSFISDEATLTGDDQPILAVWVLPLQAGDHRPEPKPFRVPASKLYVVENNINEANLDWDDFARRADEKGVFHGF
ncbi:DUF6924 domain-containing protein [Lapillicoccus sp.]|uniref:DUF6924 domain-containing protein n=1 Tax=Lapillicoccus sp. TaxID=1909287 RepID=UPI0032664756